MKLSMKKLEILKKNIKFRGGLLGLKDFLMLLELLLLLWKLLLLLEVKTVKLMLLVYKLLMLVFRVNAANTNLELLKD
ncbi:hypothetical protein Tco_0517873 [Tanacetum coccineum]